ncbi:membrane protein [Arsukibacterium ikkense]|uniref:Protein MgtC n=1 Tax=Arsukibacterium ikkense TaxID=336831 RepID=A0A0M2V5K3_9GAMM|nr:MgtC/SapB family protein [Arsukibacterium ikkense]KKO46112.1 membrane protein [Arsukibacterium ikkense]
MLDWQLIFAIDPLDWQELLTALLCGFIIGLERQLRGKPAGIRTSILIIMGTYVFIAASMSVNSEMTDPSRIIGQVITGVGFLGAGVMLSRDGMVLGVTSAATIWVLAAIGVCIGIGQDLVAIKLSLLVVTVLVGIGILESSSSAMRRGVHRTYNEWVQRANGSLFSRRKEDIAPAAKVDIDDPH